MINLISAIYDHAVEQMEGIDETIEGYRQKIAALQTERDALSQLYDIAAEYRNKIGSGNVSGIGNRSAVNNVPRPVTVNDPYVGISGTRNQTDQLEGFVFTTAPSAVTQDKSIQSTGKTTNIF